MADWNRLFWNPFPVDFLSAMCKPGHIAIGLMLFSDVRKGPQRLLRSHHMHLDGSHGDTMLLGRQSLIS